MQRAVVINNLSNYFDDPTLLTGSLRCACVYKEAGLLYTRRGSSQRAAKCGLHNLALYPDPTLPERKMVWLQYDILPDPVT